MDACIFCMIVAGDMAAQVVYEDDLVLAFDDIMPQAPVHALVIPKAHYADMDDDVPPEVLAAVLKAASEVAKVKGIDESGYRVLVNNGRDANQTVHHLHFHVIGGRSMTHGMVNFADED